MPADRKRENRGNQVYNVGVQGRKTGITLEDKGIRDEHGMEAISGIFSSPAKSPARRSPGTRQAASTVTGSDSMDTGLDPIAALTPGRLLRGNVPNLPPPKSRSPMKTNLGSSPRRQSSMGPRAQAADSAMNGSSRAVSHPLVNRRLDFEQEEESSLQETPALSGSGARRGRARRNVYELEESPSAPRISILDESIVQEEITANEESAISNSFGGVNVEESMAGIVMEDSMAGAEPDNVDITVEEESEVVEAVKQPAKRGRKRKSDAIASPAEDDSPVVPKKRAGTAKVSAAAKGKQPLQPSPANPRRAERPKRISEITEEEPSTASEESPVEVGKKASGSKGRGRPAKTPAVEESLVESEPAEDAPAPTKKSRGRPAKAQSEKEPAATKKADAPTFKKPQVPKAKSSGKPERNVREKTAELANSGKLVNATGLPLTKDDIEHMSTTSTSSRFGRGRSLSIFRHVAPDEVGRVPTTGRHKIAPIDWWANERAEYTKDGSLKALTKKEEEEEEVRRRQGRRKAKGKKNRLASIDEDDEDDLEEWERKEGVLVGTFRDYDVETDTTADTVSESAIAWAPKGIQALPVASGEFKFTKLASAENGFFSWGCLEFDKDGIKRPKNSRRMYMVFHVMQGAVQVTVNDSLFTVHKGGTWQVPRGNFYEIRNVAKGVSRVFFSQSYESKIEVQVEAEE